MYQGSYQVPLARNVATYCFQWSANHGCFRYAKDSGNFGRNSNGKVRFGFFRPEYSGSPREVVHLFRLEYSDRNLTNRFFALIRDFGNDKKWQELFLLVGAV